MIFFLFTEFKFRKFCPTRPEGAEAHKAARPGLRASALSGRAVGELLPFTFPVGR